MDLNEETNEEFLQLERTIADLEEKLLKTQQITLSHFEGIQEKIDILKDQVLSDDES